jgi:hypothetical protein
VSDPEKFVLVQALVFDIALCTVAEVRWLKVIDAE